MIRLVLIELILENEDLGLQQRQNLRNVLTFPHWPLGSRGICHAALMQKAAFQEMTPGCHEAVHWHLHTHAELFPKDWPAFWEEQTGDG